MYIPTHFNVENQNEMADFIRKNSFGILVSEQNGKITASHLPMILTENNGEIRIEGHVAKGNLQWHDFEKNENVMLIFQGDHGYVSPLLYQSKESVPTWNYMAVHVYGSISLIHGDSEKIEGLEKMISRYEPEYLPQWKSLSEEYKQKMLGGIMAFVVRAEKLEGKFKLSQNRPEQDRESVAQHFLSSENEMLNRLGSEMKIRNKK